MSTATETPPPIDPTPPRRKLTAWLDGLPTPLFSLWAGTVGFSVYFCMYAFRKPFSAAEFEGQVFWGDASGAGRVIQLKTALVIGQIVGYSISKYLGIKVCSELTRRRRGVALVGFILAAEAALLLFAVAPGPWKAPAIFLNGLPLGMVWGLVVRYLEGRRSSDFLLAMLCGSFVVASGIVKDVGRLLMAYGGARFPDLGTDALESWMPFATGLCFLPLFLLSVWLLEQLPEPSARDVSLRHRRPPMDARQRWIFFREFWLGLTLLFVVYFFLTAFRDFRDGYGVEILGELGADRDSGTFTRMELPVAFGVIGALGMLNLIRDSRRALLGIHVVMVAGMLLLGVSTWLLDAGLISGFWWMTMIGLAAYLAYVPFNAILFERLVASTNVAANAVFAIYVGDALGYTGSVGLQLYKDLGAQELSRLDFFRYYTYFLCAVGTIGLVVSGWYFRRDRAKSSRVAPT